MLRILLKQSHFCLKKRLFSTKYLSKNKEILPQQLSPVETGLRYGLGSLVAPLYLLGLGWFDIRKNYVGVITHWGKYIETIPDGLHFRIPIGLVNYRVFIGQQSHKMPESKIVDANGNPIIVSGIVNFEITNPEKFIFNIEDKSYVHNQAEAVLKRVVSKYPYESRDNDQVSLKNETDEINQEMQKELEKLVSKAGVQINEFYLTDMNYAPEIAQQMLIRQQARAYIDAKNEIAEAGVQIVNDTLKQLKDAKMTIDPETEKQLITNLLTVIASGNNVQPTLPLGHQ